MIEGTCHCGAVRIEVAEAPTQVTDCNCSICRRVGSLWEYYAPAQVRIVVPTATYRRGDKTSDFHHCAVCGCTTHWSPIAGVRDTDRMGINARLLGAEILERARLQRLDGASDNWSYLDDCPLRDGVGIPAVGARGGRWCAANPRTCARWLHDARRWAWQSACTGLTAMKLALVALVAFAAAGDARAWSIGSQLDYTGCHERITPAAFRAVRARIATAPVIAPTADEAALISEVQFVPPADFKPDLAAISLLHGVRDNDLKGNNPLDSLQLTEVHGNPDRQEEHCIRSAADAGTAGDPAALDQCRSFIHERVAEALAGLAADGTVDANNRMELRGFVSFAGHVKPMLPTFYVRLGQAVHALEDGFSHTYRTPDGSAVTVVTHWIDYVSPAGAKPERDGPPHLAVLDHCEGSDPLVKRNFDLAPHAATELFEIVLDPSRTDDDTLAAVDALTAK